MVPCKECGDDWSFRRRRGLCRRCAADPRIARRYRPRKIRLGPAPPLVPTAAVPGSPEKIEVLRQRALFRQPLFIRGDYRFRLMDVQAWM